MTRKPCTKTISLIFFLSLSILYKEIVAWSIAFVNRLVKMFMWVFFPVKFDTPKWQNLVQPPLSPLTLHPYQKVSVAFSSPWHSDFYVSGSGAIPVATAPPDPSLWALSCCIPAQRCSHQSLGYQRKDYRGSFESLHPRAAR